VFTRNFPAPVGDSRAWMRFGLHLLLRELSRVVGCADWALHIMLFYIFYFGSSAKTD